MAKKHEKMLTIPDYKGNSNQGHTMKIPPHMSYICYLSSTITTNVGEDLGRKEPSHTAGESVS
jgi:hypothetical protein